jgi:hypothetical protein
MDDKKDMATIPYIAHEARMFKAYQREKSLKALLIASNCLWIGVMLFMLLR